MNNPNLTKPLYSVIILIYHRTQELVDMAKECVASVKNSGENQEIVIVDNGSTKRFDWENHCDTYIRFNKNMGISRGWNAGILASRGTYPVIIGDDVIVHDGWLEAMQKGIEMPNAGMCNPHVEHLPAGMGVVENYKWPSGACFMLHRDAINKVGYFDENTYFPANHEDWDYWTRLYKNGFKIYTNFSLSIQHLEGQTVHAPDISSKNEITRKAYFSKWGFNPTPIFCGDAQMPVFDKS